MPNITSSGTVNETTNGFDGLRGASYKRNLLFAGTTQGTTCYVQYTDDTGTLRTLEGGTIDELPKSLEVSLNANLSIVTTGSPNFNLTVVS